MIYYKEMIFNKLYVYTIGLLFCATLFLNINFFPDKEILSKWYSFFICTLLGGIFFIWQLKKESLLGFKNVIPNLVCLLLSYVFIRILTSLNIDIKQLLSFFCFFILYIMLLYTRFLNRKGVDRLIVILCFVQAGYGLGQYWGIFSTTSIFPIVGSFDNPAGFAACVVAGFPFCLSLCGSKRILQFVTPVVVLIIILSVILSQSRSGLVAIVLMTIFYLQQKYLKNRIVLKRSVLIAAILLCICVLFLKIDSSVGRVLVWNVSLDMLENNLLWGLGNGSFDACYMENQAVFLKKHGGGEGLQLTDNVHHPFNEYILLVVEHGLVVFFLFLLICFFIFKNNRWNVTPCFLSFLGILVFACFSYPLRYPFVWAVLAYDLSELSFCKERMESNQKDVKVFFKCVATILMIFGLGIVFMNMKFEYKWKQLAQVIPVEKKKQMILEEYDMLYNSIHKHSLFLYNYGSILNRVGNYDESLSILLECERRYNDYDVQLMIADNYLHLGQWEKSECRYMNALRMCPNRFIPLYQLLEVYELQGKKENVFEICKKIVDKEVKIPSLIVDKIKDEAKQRMLQHSLSY